MSDELQNELSGEKEGSAAVRTRLAELFSVEDDGSDEADELRALREALQQREEDSREGGDGATDEASPERLVWLMEFLENGDGGVSSQGGDTQTHIQDRLAQLEAMEEEDGNAGEAPTALVLATEVEPETTENGQQAAPADNRQAAADDAEEAMDDDQSSTVQDRESDFIFVDDDGAAHPANGEGATAHFVEDTSSDSPLFGDGYEELPPLIPGVETDIGVETEIGGETEPAAQEQGLERVEDDEYALDDVPTDRVTARLLERKRVTASQVRSAQARLDKMKEKGALWRVLADGDGVNRESVFAEAARLYAFPLADLKDGGPPPEFVKKVMESFDEEHKDKLIALGVAPFSRAVEKKTGATHYGFITYDPARPELFRLMQNLQLDRFALLYAPEQVVRRSLTAAFPQKNEDLERVERESMGLDLGINFEEETGLIDEEALEAEISRSTLINLFEATLVEAVRGRAPDIHIYPNPNKQVEIHFRTDARLQHWYTEDKVHPEAILAVIKDNSMNIDRFERDSAQDGFIQRKIDNALIRFRVSILPIANASSEIRSESIVIRVLDDRKVITDLRQLGLLEGALERFDEAIRQPNGMVILTGPTGSGKSTTLVAALHQVVTPEVNVLTVEDPGEYITDGVRQIKLNQKLALEDALRSILRHDPDVVMVGEMRDKSTAELAIKLANTGHLAFSTLHTNDAPSAVSRLFKMGIEPFLIAYAINLVVAQRLIRTLCPDCKTYDDDPDPILLKRLGFTDAEIDTTDFYTDGTEDDCPTCHGAGYKGRRACSEALYFSRDIRHMIVDADGMINEDEIRQKAEEEGMLTLQASAREVVKMGETSVREMVRVVSTTE